MKQPNWEELEVIPAGKDTEKKILDYFKQIKRITFGGGVRDEIVNRCAGKVVLDVGALEHGYSNLKEEGMFFRIKKTAEHVTGLDIIKEDVELMKKDGYDFVCVDATSKVDLPLKYDVVNVGDVIEHVDSPVDLLNFCKRQLKDDGEILVTTPNPYFIKTILNLFKEKEQIVNFQHVAWITPCMALELGRRTGLTLSEYWINNSINPVKRFVQSFLPQSMRTSVYMFVYKKGE